MKNKIIKVLIAALAFKTTAAFSVDFTVPTNRPADSRSWITAFSEEDSRGTLARLRGTIEGWNYVDEMVDNHDLSNEVRGDIKGRKSFITSNMLQFFERKVSEESRKPDPTDSLVAVARINNGLRPTSSIGLSDSFKFKFRGNLLQGQGTMVVVNPYLDFNVQMNLSKGAFVEGSKVINGLDIKSTLNYSLKNRLTTFKVDRKITQDLNADVTYQAGASTHNAGDVSVKLMYSRPF